VTAPEHVPVMAAEVLAHLAPSRGEVFADCTIGSGGHAELILQAAPDTRVVGIDCDPFELELARTRLAKYGDRVQLVRSRYERVLDVLREVHLENVDGLLIDCGVSMDQLAGRSIGRGRGFSHAGDEPLLMTLDPDQCTTAASLLRELSEGELMEVFGQVLRGGETRKVVRAIVRERNREPIERTSRLTRILQTALGRHGPALAGRLSAAYLALRVAVNREISALREGIINGVEALRPGGVMVLTTFHSLEHRTARQTLRELEGGPVGPPRLAGAPEREAKVRILTPKPLFPSEAEISHNSAARSARLHGAIRL
jgi:16S rRNA (cytosine1402-N4)-methyltransferase